MKLMLRKPLELAWIIWIINDPVKVSEQNSSSTNTLNPVSGVQSLLGLFANLIQSAACILTKEVTLTGDAVAAL